MAASSLTEGERHDSAESVPQWVRERVFHASSLIGEGYVFSAIYVFPETSEVQVRARMARVGGTEAVCPFGRVHGNNGVGLVMRRETLEVVCYSSACRGIQRMEWNQWAVPNGWVFEGELVGSKAERTTISA